jgi:hypothetical protein
VIEFLYDIGGSEWVTSARSADTKSPPKLRLYLAMSTSSKTGRVSEAQLVLPVFIVMVEVNTGFFSGKIVNTVLDKAASLQSTRYAEQ